MLLLSGQWLFGTWFLRNRAFYMMHLKAIVNFGAEQSDELCLGFSWYNGFRFIKNFYEKTIITYDPKVWYKK